MQRTPNFMIRRLFDFGEVADVMLLLRASCSDKV